MASRSRLMLALLGVCLGSLPLSAQAPTGTVVGRVLDGSTQQPLAAAAVAVADRGALTDEAGRFTIRGVPAGAQTATATLIGYSSTTKPVTVVAGQTVTLEITMQTEAVQLAALVVTGYGTQKAGNISGAVKQLSTEQFQRGRIVSPEQLIQSKVAGVQVVDNNEPGGGLSIRIRGATSINASSDPLYVIDGVPVGSSGGGLSAGRNPMNFLNPEDVESITVLKDASAAAIYGANAANGVVLVTTKTGKRGMGIEYTGSISGSFIDRIPDMLNAAEFKAAVQQYAPQNLSQLKNDNTDWFGLVSRDAVGQDHNIAFTSTGESMNYRLSLGYQNQDGVMKGTTAERLSAALSYNQRLFDDRLLVKSNIKAARNHDLFTPGGVLGNAAQMGPTQPVYDATTRSGYYDWSGGIQSADNPVAILNLAQDEGTTLRSLGNVQAEYSMPFMPALKATVNVGYDITKATRQTFTPGLLHSQVKTGDGGTTYRRDDTSQSTLLETYLNYAAPLQYLPGNLDVTAGYSYSQQHGDYPWVRATGLSTDLLENYGFPSARQLQNYLWVDDSKLISFFGRANYNLNDKYLLAASVRRDGSSRFGSENAWGYFPSVSAGWRISQESFMEGLSAISDLKLRASWGKTGNQSFANYQQYTTYVVGDAQTQVQLGNEFVTTIRPGAADPNIKWEETTSYDIGVDYALFGSKLSGAIDYYQKKTEDMIFTVPVAAGTNLSNYMTTNIGSMKNRGLELSLSAKLLDGGRDGLNWNADFNAGHNANELVTINPFGGGSQQILTGLVAGGVGTYIQVFTPGQPINSFFVYEHKLEDGKPIYKDVNGDGSINEKDLYVDQNGDGNVNVDDRVARHNPLPDWILGHSSYITYGKFDFNYTLRAYLGNYVYNNVASNLGTYAEVGRGSPYNLHRSVLTTKFTQPQYLSDYYVEDASFLRLDNLTLGYSFDYAGKPLRVYGSVQNAFTMTGYTGVDPTAGLNGLDNNRYPRARTFSAGLNVRF